MKRTLVGVGDVTSPEDALALEGHGASTSDAVLPFDAMGTAIVVVSAASRAIVFKSAVYCLTASATASLTGTYGSFSWLVGG